MNLSFQTKEDQTTILFSGPLEINSVSKIREELLDQLRSNQKIRLDLSSITDCDTAGMQLLIALFRQLKRRNQPFSHQGQPSDSILRSSRELGLDYEQLFNVE